MQPQIAFCLMQSSENPSTRFSLPFDTEPKEPLWLEAFTTFTTFTLGLNFADHFYWQLSNCYSLATICGVALQMPQFWFCSMPSTS